MTYLVSLHLITVLPSVPVVLVQYITAHVVIVMISLLSVVSSYWWLWTAVCYVYVGISTTSATVSTELGTCNDILNAGKFVFCLIIAVTIDSYLLFCRSQW